MTLSALNSKDDLYHDGEWIRDKRTRERISSIVRSNGAYT